jgi:hypothetical protein
MILHKKYSEEYVASLKKASSTNELAYQNYFSSGKVPDVEKGEPIEIESFEDPGVVKLETGKDDKNTSSFDYENAVRFYEAYSNLPILLAIDPGFWTYLTHERYHLYLQKRWKYVKKNSEEASGTQSTPKSTVRQHWFLDNMTRRSYSRHGLAGLWWAVHLTVRKERKDPYEMTKILFSTKDLKELVTGNNLGSNPKLVDALFDYYSNNPEDFKKGSKEKLREIAKMMNRSLAVRSYHLLEKEELSSLMKLYTKRATEIITKKEALNK